MEKLNIIEPRSGTTFVIKKGERLKIVDIEGEQVADLICFNSADPKEFLSSGRTFDYEETIFLTQGNALYSNRSQVLLRIIEDTAGRHDFLLTPCSADTFRILYGHEHPHKGCFGNLRDALAPHGILPDDIEITFNVFMNVQIDSSNGKISVEAPQTKAGDYIVVEAAMDLIVGLTACSAEMSNNYSFKPIGYMIL